MTGMDIPFKKLYPGDTPRPWLPVVIRNPHTDLSVRVWGLIDTGADDCAVPAEYATLLGHNLQAGIRKTINTGNGQTAAYAHTLCLETDSIKVDNVLIDFMPNLNVVLLGVKSFLSNFILTINYKKSTFSLK
ncbi:MAG: retroviral-like aspartic protease family protein [Deltaproteobacteria bacterium]|jgi:predicted aspartyl protease|nr:retroviral-like aspartic protease family protein [Deltaproteobacteria bacterium]MCL5880699.1 retroviral-like aspartic protease family protein [Deltaproteobacteria bacterium]